MPLKTDVNKIAYKIHEELHDSLRGFKRGKPLEWLSTTLCRLQSTSEPGLAEIANSFLKQMKHIEHAPGFLLEIQVAASLMDVAGERSVFGNRQDGRATSPCDVTMFSVCARADVQCKAVLNVTNEIHIAEFRTWIEKRFSNLEPGISIDFRCNTAANEKSFQALKALMQKEHSTWYLDSKLVYAGTQHDLIVLHMKRSDQIGAHITTTWSSADDLDLAQAVDVGADRQILAKKLAKSRNTFAHDPTSRQHNFVAVSLPDLAFLRLGQITDALYGRQGFHIRKGSFISFIDKTGLFYRPSFDFCSALVLVRQGHNLKFNNLIYPHPSHHKDLRLFWEGKKGFRVVSHPHTDGMVDEEHGD